MAWYYTNGDTKVGPVDAAELPRLVETGAIHARTRVWRQGLRGWEPAHEHIDDVQPPLTGGPRYDDQPPPVGPWTAPRERAEQPQSRLDRWTVEAAPDPPRGGYRRESGPRDAFREFFRRFLDFRGRSNRGEYWYWVLDSLVIGLALGIADGILFGGTGPAPLSGFWSLGTLIPSVALGVRRLHDIGRSGWWLLLLLVPVIGVLVLLYWAVQRPETGPNRYG